MPKKSESKLMRKARDMGLRGESRNAYVYGSLRSTGWKPAKGRVSRGRRSR